MKNPPLLSSLASDFNNRLKLVFKLDLHTRRKLKVFEEPAVAYIHLRDIDHNLEGQVPPLQPGAYQGGGYVLKDGIGFFFF